MELKIGETERTESFSFQVFLLAKQKNAFSFSAKTEQSSKLKSHEFLVYNYTII